MSKRSAITLETGLLALFVACGPFLRGFIFESELTAAFVIASLGYLVALVRKKLPHDRILYVLLALTAMYAAGTVYGADHREALAALLTPALLILLYVFALFTPRDAMDRIWSLLIGLTALSVPLSVATNRFVDGRLAGFIDYANGYAILLLIVILLAIALSVRGRPQVQIKWLQLAIFLCAGGIYLTESRTVLVLMVAAFIPLYIWSRKDFPSLWMRSCLNALLGIAAAAAYGWSPWLGIPAALVFGLSLRITDTLLSRRSTRLILSVAAPLLGIVALAVGTGTASRWKTLLSHTGEGITRLVYYRDAWSMVMDSPIWGFGAGAWDSLQYRYQSSEYFTAYVHSQPLQVMTETGFMGLVLFAVACAALIIRGISVLKLKAGQETLFGQILLLAMGVLLIHSLVDFSLSFPFLLGLLFVLGAAAGAGPAEAAEPAKRTAALKLATTAVISGSLVVAIMLFVSDQFQSAADRAIAEGRKADAVRWLDKSASWAIFPDRQHDSKARLYMAEYETSKDSRYLDVARAENGRALDVEPNQIWYRKLHSDIQWLEGNKQEALDVLRALTEQNRFMERWREELQQKEAEAER